MEENTTYENYDEYDECDEKEAEILQEVENRHKAKGIKMGDIVTMQSILCILLVIALVSA